MFVYLSVTVPVEYTCSYDPGDSNIRRKINNCYLRQRAEKNEDTSTTED